MNALLELLDTDAAPDVDDIRAATRASVRGLAGDRRICVLTDPDDLLQVIRQNASCSDQRLFDCYTREISEAHWAFEKDFTRRPHGRYIFNLTDPAVLTVPSGAELQSYVRTTCEMRLGVLPYRLQIFDRSSALLAVDPDDNSAGAYLISEPALVAALVALHRRLWLTGRRDIDDLIPDPNHDLSWTSLLAQLVAGRTDEAGARATGTSLRTYRRRVQTHMTDLGVDSRFAAGGEAQRRGLLELVA